ncbi:class I SAM-dependent methyltransferase [Laribacter hongkongensis]|uniref:class I SAM-dependent methyltransferase n=1 Tax=Laribacter hongkongensis TaxID=168471 RepID=UPI001EFDC1DD|nr:class I SAM-dependent methyltransferase [Laribacter hongkongensis]MCG9101354.1 class I SAM-dependent methyltransferase [Laribacter hongkongensis]MCG9104084.1 class I SAM-dependent methyltransferase [Laribacter hongkongensis]MCG9113440.1 class I SAM-dependent methyltransferase [Laribacter hongkongensis]MCG9118920.1 class I SAM-dependent methyltransferase [Laribacter hongkongensis]
MDKVGIFNLRSVTPFLDLTRRYLAPGSLVLEGGCGTSGKVAALESAGFRAIGIDYTKEIVARLNNACPQLDIREGDVFSIDFADGHFDGYWSFGVVEHFWGSYQSLFDEARGFCVITGTFF